MKINKDLEAQNAWFASLSVAEKKMAIAQDVIDQVRAEQYVARKGQYFVLPDEDFDNVCEGNPQEMLVEGTVCKVCAMGAIFASRIRLGNSVSEVGSYGSMDLPILAAVEGVFTYDEMKVIETGFEGSVYGFYPEDDNVIKLRRAATNFAYSVGDPQERLIAMMYGIINNNGNITFDEALMKEIKK